MARTFIATVGTSLLTNKDDRPWAGWRFGETLPDPELVQSWIEDADPARASAETNTLSRLDTFDEDEIVLLHSQTKEGKYCAQRLAEFYEPQVAAVHIEEIGSLGYAADRFSVGLKSLVEIVARHYRRARNRNRLVVFCATGGFKAEIAYLNLLGALLDVEVHYVHELHRQLVTLPALPLDWNVDFVKEHKTFFEWIDAEPRRTEEVESWLKAEPRLRALVVPCEDGHTYLSAAGDLLYQAAKARVAIAPVTWPEPVDLPPENKNHLSAVGHHRPPGLEGLVDAICGIGCVSAVRHGKANLGDRGVVVKDPGKGVLAVQYERGGRAISLYVETTARGPDQSELVADYIRKLLRRH